MYDRRDKSDDLSPTVQTDSILLMGVIDTHKNRDITTMDMGSAYLIANNDREIIMVLHTKLAEMMVRVNPELYRSYVTLSAKKFTYAIRTFVKSLVRYVEGRSAVLQETTWRPGGHGI